MYCVFVCPSVLLHFPNFFCLSLCLSSWPSPSHTAFAFLYLPLSLCACIQYLFNFLTFYFIFVLNLNFLLFSTSISFWKYKSNLRWFRSIYSISCNSFDKCSMCTWRFVSKTEDSLGYVLFYSELLKSNCMPPSPTKLWWFGNGPLGYCILQHSWWRYYSIFVTICY